MRFVKNRADAKDKFYTPPRTVSACCRHLDFSKYDMVIEPAAGRGAFFDRIKHGNKIGLELYPDDAAEGFAVAENSGIQQRDWLQYAVPPQYKNVLVVGNPPFGVANRLSRRFIEHALAFDNVKTIAFILPQVYKKHTQQKILPATWRIKKILPIEPLFIKDGRRVFIPCAFFIFDKSRGRDMRFNPALYTETADFTFGSRDDYDVFVFGAAPAKVILRPSSNNRGYYLKSKIPPAVLMEKLKNARWRGNSCASGGVFWLTKAELCCNYIENYGVSSS